MLLIYKSLSAPTRNLELSGQAFLFPSYKKQCFLALQSAFLLSSQLFVRVISVDCAGHLGCLCVSFQLFDRQNHGVF